MIWKFLNQGKDSGVHMKTPGCTSLHFGALLWVDGEKTPEIYIKIVLVKS